MAGEQTQRVDVLRRQLSKYLRDDHVPSPETRRQIERALGLELDALAEEDDGASRAAGSSVVRSEGR
jgi:transcriptional regulator with XRE-family HTH domain